VVSEAGVVRSRAIAPREAGPADGAAGTTIACPLRTTAALHLTGDGVAVPVVRHLARSLLEPLLAEASAMAAE